MDFKQSSSGLSVLFKSITTLNHMVKVVIDNSNQIEKDRIQSIHNTYVKYMYGLYRPHIFVLEWMV